MPDWMNNHAPPPTTIRNPTSIATASFIGLAPRRALRQAIKIRCDIPRVLLAYPEIGHRFSRINVLRILNPSNQVIRRIRQNAGDVSSRADPVEIRTDCAVGAVNSWNLMASAAAVSANRGFAVSRIAAGHF